MKALLTALFVLFSGAAHAAPSYPTLQAVTGLNDPSLAHHGADVVDYTTERPFLNVMKFSRNPVGQKSDGAWGFYSFDYLLNNGHLDANHYPISIPSGADRGIDFEMVPGCGGKAGCINEMAGNYTFTWDGTGTLDFFGDVSNVVKTPNQITFDTTGTYAVTLTITSVSAAPNHPKNFELVKTTDIPLYKSGAIFNPEFLDRYKDARHFRFMNWMYANDPYQYETQYPDVPPDWGIDKFPPVDRLTYSEGWMPPEIMVALANELGADPWFNFKYMATDAYVNAFATIVEEQLDPDLDAHFELSNEVWNGAFSAHYAATALAQLEFYDTVPTCDIGNWPDRQHFGKRHYEVMSEITSVFSGQLDRIVRVLGTQTDPSAYPSTQALDAVDWLCADPGNYVAPYTVTDAVAGVSYFGYTSVTVEAIRDALLAAVNDGGIDEDDWHYDLLMEDDTTYNSGPTSITPLLASVSSVPDQIAGITADRAALRAISNYTDHGSGNIRYLLYEGGQHVHHSAFTDVPAGELEKLQAHFEAFVGSQEMATLYENLWDGLEAVPIDGPFMQFLGVEDSSIYGTWGMYANLGSPLTPRATFLESKNTATAAWWESRSGSHFQDGLTVNGTSGGDILAGSNEEDYVLAGAGDDVIYTGPGWGDHVNGGTGDDDIYLRGNEGDWTIVGAPTTGYTLTNTAEDVSNLTVFAVEEAIFEDDGLLKLNTDLNQ
jgi:hypothetical protein